MAYIEYLLEKLQDPHAFEMLCAELMLKEGYSAINPVGGTGDKGRDAENVIYSGQEGKRTILFQFSLEKGIPSKVKKTLRRIREAGISGDEVIFVFSTNAKPGECDKLRERALVDYGLNIDIRGQRYLTVRLGSKAYSDVVEKFFASEISQMKRLYEDGQLFVPDSIVPDKEKRCLINLMHYARHPMAGDIKIQIIRQAIRQVMARYGEKGADVKEISQIVFDYLPPGTAKNGMTISEEIKALIKNGEVEVEGDKYHLKAEERRLADVDAAEIFTGRKALIEWVYRECGDETVKALGLSAINRAIDEFLSNLFRKHGVEIANEILNPAGTLENALSPDSIDAILSQVVSKWPPVNGNAFRKAMKSIITRPQGGALDYLNALSNSYICMQLLNADPESINVQRKRNKESVAVLDTDVILTGIVEGSRREQVSKSIPEMCLKQGMVCFAFDGSIEEILFRIKRSVALYEDLGCPAVIPPEKKQFVSDIFLDSFWDALANGYIRSFDEFIANYYDPTSPHDLIRHLISDKLSVPIERMDKYYLIPQEDKVTRIRATIEKSRAAAISFKNPIMYQRDALAMVVVEQQNREMIKKGSLGRWYLISEDRHILKAYLDNKNSFKIKPSILPICFLEILRQCPEGKADEEVFRAILKSEAMLHGAGRNYTPIIAALTKLGVDALSLPTDSLLELIDIMDRADFTQWLVKLRAEDEVLPEVAEEIREALVKVIDESKSRTENINRLQEIYKKRIVR